MHNFPGAVQSLRMFKYKEKTAFTYIIQSVVHWQNSSTFQTVLKKVNSQHKLGATLLLLVFHLNN